MREIVIKSLEESEANKLPSLPHILIKLLRACRDEDICFDTISDIISRDAALSAKIVSVANSPVYGRARHLKSLKHTLMFLGLDTIKSIAITAAVQQFFSRYSNDKSQFLKSFWKHSLNAALLARSLAKLTSYKYVEEAYIAGLLHDIGKLVFETHAGFDYNRLAHGIYPADEVLAQEQAQFDITHDELGGRLMEKWEMTPVVCDAVRYHHAELDDIQDAHHLVKIINLANILASSNADSETITLSCAANLFDLSEAIIREMMDEALEEVGKIATSLDIDIGSNETSEQDEMKQVELAQEVRDMSLVQSSQLPFEIVEGDAIYASIQKCLLILFGIKHSIIFTCDPDSGELSVATDHKDDDGSILHQLCIPLASRSLVSKALQQKSIEDSFCEQDAAGSLAVIDRQLISALQADGLVCVPIIRAGTGLAVMALGIRSKRHASLARNYNLLRIFAQEIADKIVQAEQLASQRNDMVDLQNSRFASKAREIIHETNNPLSVIRNYLQILGNRLDEQDPAQDDLKTIREEIDRVGNIILRCAENLDKVDDSQRQPVNINELIGDIVKIFRSSLFVTHNIKSRVSLADDIDTLQLDRDSIKQIISNLIKNAVEAMQDQDELSISTRNININGQAFVEVEIQDTGPGIPEHILKNIYAPVTSTKGKGHSGLGLSIVKNLIDHLGGVIACKTGDTGTVFTVQLPIK